MLEISLDSMLRMNKISTTLVLLSFSFIKLQVIQCFKSCKNVRILFLIIFTEETLSKKCNTAYHHLMNAQQGHVN